MKYDIFISYNHASPTKEVARDLAASLSKNGFKVWLDQLNLLPGSQWANEIDSAIKEASIIIFLFDKHSSNRKWFNNELKKALELGKWIVPVVTSGSVIDELPNELKDRQALVFDKELPEVPNSLEIIMARINDQKPIWSRIKEYIVNDS